MFKKTSKIDTEILSCYSQSDIPTLREMYNVDDSDIVETIDKHIDDIIRNTIIYNDGLCIGYNKPKRSQVILKVTDAGYCSSRDTSSTDSSSTRVYKSAEDIKNEALAIKKANKTIAKLVEENKRLNKELANSKKKSKGFLSWLFS